LEHHFSSFPLRTTLTLSDDVFLITRQVAARDRVSPGEAMLKSRYSVLHARDEIITTEHVRRLMDEEGI
jgi:hypothetical protein